MQNKNPFDNNKKIDKSYILKNCNIVDTKNLKIRNGDIFLKNKLIEKIGNNLSDTVDSQTKVIDCRDLYVSPGLIDMRVSITEPGHEHKETIKSASKSAASGGITSIICMPNTSPPIDQPAIIHSIQRRARELH